MSIQDEKQMVTVVPKATFSAMRDALKAAKTYEPGWINKIESALALAEGEQEGEKRHE